MGKQSKIKQRNPYVVHAIRRHAGSHTRPYKSERGELNRKDAMHTDEGYGLGIEGWSLIEGDGYAIGGGSSDVNGGGFACDDLNPISL